MNTFLPDSENFVHQHLHFWQLKREQQAKKPENAYGYKLFIHGYKIIRNRKHFTQSK